MWQRTAHGIGGTEVWQPWVKFATEDYVDVNFQGQQTKLVLNNDVDQEIRTGIWYGAGGANASASLGDNPFPTLNGNFTIIVENPSYPSPGYGTQLAYASSPSLPIKKRSMSSDGTFGVWETYGAMAWDGSTLAITL